MKVLTVIGARPQFIKAATVSRAILKYNATINGQRLAINEVIVHTGQHYDANMSDIFFEELDIPRPDYHLGIGGGPHGQMTGRQMEKIEEVLLKEKPDWVLVYGDTNSTLAGALAAAKLHIPVAHVEAGLRSFNMRMPEEINRILTDRTSTLLFCPTQTAVDNLNNEGIKNWHTNAKVVLSGDVMQDGAFYYKNLAQKPLDIAVEEDFVLCTIHRAENTSDLNRLSNIISALNEIAKTNQVILPLHPRTRKIIQNSNNDTSNLTIIDPVGYLNMIWLIDNCCLVMTDSGGLQKEAFFFKKACITMRDETEWIELVRERSNVLAGADRKKILDAYQSQKLFKTDQLSQDLYGGGKASERIVLALLRENSVNPIRTK